MTVGAAVVELHVHGSRSLKAKRGVVRSIVSRVRSRFNVSVSEVGGQDTWQRAVLGIAAAGSDATRVRSSLTRVVDFIESLHLAEIRASDLEIVELPYAESGDADDAAPLPWEEGSGSAAPDAVGRREEEE